MNKKRLLILGAIVVLSLGSLGVVWHLTTESSVEESEGGYVQNPAESSEAEQSQTKPSESEQSQTKPSEDEQSQTKPSEEQNPTEPSETEEESTHVPKYADYTEDIGTYFDLDIYDMRELSRNTVERASEFDYQYNKEALANIDPGLFSESVNNIRCADIDCHKVLLSVLSQYADDHDKDYSVFEMERYYKSMFIEDGIWGHKVLDTASKEMLYIAFSDAAPDMVSLIGYLYKVEECTPAQYAEYTESLSTYFDLDNDDMQELSRNVIERAPEFDYQYNEEALVYINPRLFSVSVNSITYDDIDCHKVLLSVLSQYADDHGKDYSVFEMESYYKSMFVEDGMWGHKVLDTETNEMLYIAYATELGTVYGYLYKVE